MAVNGKSKGSSFERQIAKLFDTWWNEVPGTFWRTKNSGGIDEPGDIAPRYRPQHSEKVWWPFVVECKHYKHVNLLNLFREQNKLNVLKQWWEQSTREQKEAIKLGFHITPIRLIVFKANGYPTMCVISKNEFEDRCTTVVDNDLLFNLADLDKYLTYTDAELKETLVISCLDNFIKTFSRAELERMFKND